MNLSRVPDRTAEESRLLVKDAVGKIGDPIIVEGLRTFLIPPRQEMRTWDWHKPYAKYPVWVVAESSQDDYGIVFSDYGFAPSVLGDSSFHLMTILTQTIVGIPVWKKRLASGKALTLIRDLNW